MVSRATESPGPPLASPPRWAVTWSERERIFRILPLDECIYAGQRAFLGPRQVDFVLVGVEQTFDQATQTVALLEESRGLVWNSDAKAWLKESNHLKTSA